MSVNHYANLKSNILKIAKQILEAGEPMDLCELQYYLGDINCNEDGVDFGDGESHTPDEIVMMTFQE